MNLVTGGHPVVTPKQVEAFKSKILHITIKEIPRYKNIGIEGIKMLIYILNIQLKTTPMEDQKILHDLKNPTAATMCGYRHDLQPVPDSVRHYRRALQDINTCLISCINVCIDSCYREEFLRLVSAKPILAID
jgi:hypothetical protein